MEGGNVEFIDHFLVPAIATELTHDCVKHYVAITSATVKLLKAKD
jgi:hypothetical protein